MVSLVRCILKIWFFFVKVLLEWWSVVTSFSFELFIFRLLRRNVFVKGTMGRYQWTKKPAANERCWLCCRANWLVKNDGWFSRHSSAEPNEIYLSFELIFGWKQLLLRCNIAIILCRVTWFVLCWTDVNKSTLVMLMSVAIKILLFDLDLDVNENY